MFIEIEKTAIHIVNKQQWNRTYAFKWKEYKFKTLPDEKQNKMKFPALFAVINFNTSSRISIYLGKKWWIMTSKYSSYLTKIQIIAW
jgi:hypothetical protein